MFIIESYATASHLLYHYHVVLGLLGQHAKISRKYLAFRVILLGLCAGDINIFIDGAFFYAGLFWKRWASRFWLILHRRME